MEPAIIIPVSILNCLPETARQQILELLSSPASEAKPSNCEGGSPYIETDGPAELAGALVRKLTDKLSDKTLNTLRVIAESKEGRFRMTDVINATPDAENYRSLSGVWSALTRRVRKIVGDQEAYLILWIGEGDFDDQGNYIDHEGEVAPITHQALRAYFRLD